MSESKKHETALRTAVAYQDGAISRRSFLKVCAIAGVAPAMLLGIARNARADVRVVHSNWGGDAVSCYESIYVPAFENAHEGSTVVIDGTGPLEGKIKAMVEAGDVVWDVCDVDAFNILRLGKQEMLEPYDYSIVDKAKILSPYTWEYGCLGYWYSNILAWDSDAVGETPTWADFFDVEKYPGKRTLYKWAVGSPECALMADGVAPDELYPLDLDRAWKKIESVKDHLVFWGSGAESQQMFLQGEVVMGNIWHTRASVLERDTDEKVKWTWDKGQAAPAGWLTPKGNPAGIEPAMQWVAAMQEPALQVAVMNCFGQGPANPAAADLMTPAERRLHPAAPENYKVQIPIDSEYYAVHYDQVLNEYLDLISA